MTELRNFTPHLVVLRTKENIDIPFTSMGSIRMVTASKDAGTVNGIPMVKMTVNKESTIVPESEIGVFFIVSGMVREAFPERKDFISPATDPAFVIRNEKGFVEAVTAFIRN